jgi:hypothetical protein
MLWIPLGLLVFALADLAGMRDILTVDSEALTVTRKNWGQVKNTVSIRWDTLEHVSVVGEGGSARIVVWFRSDSQPPATWAATHRVKPLLGGYAVCDPSRAAGWLGLSERLFRIRETLAHFAGDKYVESVDALHHAWQERPWLPPEAEAAVRKLISQDKKIEAVKLVHQRAPLGPEAAKDLVDAMVAGRI